MPKKKTQRKASIPQLKMTANTIRHLEAAMREIRSGMFDPKKTMRAIQRARRHLTEANDWHAAMLIAVNTNRRHPGTCEEP